MTEVPFTGQLGAAWRYWTDQGLGEGFFSTVYAGVGSDETPVAVKVVQKDRLSGVIGDRLLWREVEIGRQIADSGGNMLLPVIDACDTDEALLLVMVRADGALAGTEMPMDDPAVTSVLVDVTSGLQQLHAIGLIHRDLKPANVLRHDCSWKLTDFGIARDQEIGTQDLTFAGWGSHLYMAPEIWELKSPTVKTDLYALGCLAYELMTGRPPYPGSRGDARVGHVMGPPREVPASNIVLGRLVSSLLAKDPGDRPQDAREVLERLRFVSSPLSPAQQRVAHRLADRATQRDRTAASTATSRSAAEARRQLIVQARRGLLEIIHDALRQLQPIEPSAKVEERTVIVDAIDRAVELDRKMGPLLGRDDTRNVPARPPSFFLSVDNVTIRIDYRETMGYSPGDMTAATGGVVIPGRHPVSTKGIVQSVGRLERPICQLRYEKVDHRFVWHVYRYKTGIADRPNKADAEFPDLPPGLGGEIAEFTAEMLLEMLADCLGP